MFRYLQLGFLSTLAVVGMSARLASAHYPWLIVDEDGRAVYFFGESIADRTYHLPPSIARAKLFVGDDEKREAIEMLDVDTEQLVGKRSKARLPQDVGITSRITFGIYHGSRLEYYTQFLGRKLPESFGECRPFEATLQAHAVDTDLGVDVYVLWQGKPLADTEVKLFCEKGNQQGAATTDADGRVSFTGSQVENGLNGILVGHTAADAAGEWEGKSYTATSHYLTATFCNPEAPTIAKNNDAEKMKSASGTSDAKARNQSAVRENAKLAELPFGITSFGAARLGDAIYVYGGHTGDAHAYWDEGQSKQLLKLDLTRPTEAWEVVSEGERLQGLGMVAHGSSLILVGGFEARNKQGEEHDLHSLATVRSFDVSSREWSNLPALPQGRSSHDAALVGDRLYVVGGWLMDGAQATQWHSTALSMDLNAVDPKWTEIAKPPFMRRALALAAHQGKLFALGGMNEAGGPTRNVEIYDPQTNAWASGPELLGESGMDGFGAAAWSVNGRLVVTNIRGEVQVLSEDGQRWTSQGSARDARFFHRMLPWTGLSFVSVGGANMESGKFLEPEIIQVK